MSGFNFEGMISPWYWTKSTSDQRRAAIERRHGRSERKNMYTILATAAIVAAFAGACVYSFDHISTN